MKKIIPLLLTVFMMSACEVNTADSDCKKERELLETNIKKYQNATKGIEGVVLNELSEASSSVDYQEFITKLASELKEARLKIKNQDIPKGNCATVVNFLEENIVKYKAILATTAILTREELIQVGADEEYMEFVDQVNSVAIFEPDNW